MTSLFSARRGRIAWALAGALVVGQVAASPLALDPDSLPMTEAVFELTLADAPLAQAQGAAPTAVNATPAAAAGPNVATQTANGAGELTEFLVNLARYATWPTDPMRKELAICYAHGGGLPAGAMTLEDATVVKGLPVALRQIATPTNVTSCNVVWLNSDVRPAPRAWLANAGDRAILTVSNYADFTADGGIVGAYRLNGDWRFEINLEALQRSRISISAAALRLSQKPKTGRASGESK